MVKFVALYKKPAEVEAFEEHYRKIHAPLAQKMPGLHKLEVTHFFGAPQGDPPFYMMAELYFESKEALFAALNSNEGKAAAKDVMGFAGDLITMMFATVDG